jgi:regulator of protease activity HflC (stomatin/prohibitin superfamily)
MARTLFSMDIPDTLSAPMVFGAKGNGGLLVARPGNNWAVPYCSVPEGFYAMVTLNGAEILYSFDNGTQSLVWPAGFFISGPFKKVSHLVTKQTIIFDAPVKGCKTADNVTVQIDVSVAFRIMGDARRGEDPNLVGKFVHQVTPSGLESQLKDALAEEIRTLARSLKHTQVYACRTGIKTAVATPHVSRSGGAGKRSGYDNESDDDEGFVHAEAEGIQMTPPATAPLVASAPAQLDEIEEGDGRGIDVTAEMKERQTAQFMHQGVMISDVMIQDVVLPQAIVQQMSNKSLVRSKQEYEMMEQRFEMQAISLNNATRAREVDHAEFQEKAEVEGGRDTQASSDTFSERKAVRDRELQDYLEHSRQEVSQLSAETKEMCISLDFEKKRVYQGLALEAEEESATIIAEASARVRETAVAAELAKAKHTANAELVIADAEAKADELLETRRKLEIADAQLDTYEAFVRNKSVVISASKDVSLNKMLISDNVLADQAAGKTHNTMLAELNVLRMASAAYGIDKNTYIPDNSNSRFDQVVETRESGAF